MVKMTVQCDVCKEKEETTHYEVLGIKKAYQFTTHLTPLGWTFHCHYGKITCPKCKLPSESTER